MSEFSNMDFKKTGDPKVDFPEIYRDEDDSVNLDVHLAQREKENEYIKKILIEEVVENVEVMDNSIYDKRLRRPLLKRIFDVIFGNDRI